jgi:hypothetical protein
MEQASAAQTEVKASSKPPTRSQSPHPVDPLEITNPFDPRLEDESYKIALDIAKALQEVNPVAIDQIRLVVELTSEAWARDLLEETLKVESEDGVPVANGKRRRTPGGVYLYLVKQRLDIEITRKIFKKSQRKKALAPDFNALLSEWTERKSLIRKAMEMPGKANFAQAIVHGYPGRTVQKGKVALTTVKAEDVNSLPRGFPSLPEESVTSVVYMTGKQWQKVSPFLKKENDIMVLEGFPSYDTRLSAMTIFATKVMSKETPAPKPQQKAKSAS